MLWIENNQYLVAWLVYILAGSGFCFFWWHSTRLIKHRSYRELLRGFALVIIFTPQPLEASYAPAILVLLMNLLGGVESGLQGGIALLISCFFMLLLLTIRYFRHRRPKKLEWANRDGLYP